MFHLSYFHVWNRIASHNNPCASINVVERLFLRYRYDVISYDPITDRMCGAFKQIVQQAQPDMSSH